MSNLEWRFIKARLCPLVLLSFLILKNISLFIDSHPCIFFLTRSGHHELFLLLELLIYIADIM